MVLSFTEENYLKAIFTIAHSHNDVEVSTNQISVHLKNSAASVTDMLKRLALKKYIDYKPYKGAKLTEKGRKVAVRIVRKHRLWEFFLVEKLKFKWDEVHEIAEQLEHIDSDALIEKLDVYLGKPKTDPHGDPIPDANGKLLAKNHIALLNGGEKKTFIIQGVTDHSPNFLKFLSETGIGIGDVLKIESINKYDNLLKVKLNKHKEIYLSAKVAANLLVEEKV